MNCKICGKEIPKVKGKSSRATICRATFLKDGTMVLSKCQKKYRAKWHRDYWAENKGVGIRAKPSGITNTCLKCDNEFEARSKYNRVCDNCHISNNNVRVRTATVNVRGNLERAFV